MEVRVQAPDAAPDLAEITRHIHATDPAAVIDLEPASGALRISTALGTTELLAALREGGLRVDATGLAHLPSACCGGCGG